MMERNDMVVLNAFVVLFKFFLNPEYKISFDGQWYEKKGIKAVP